MKKTSLVRTLLSAFIAGMLFPFIGTVVLCLNRTDISFASIIKIHIDNSLFWILDMVPIAFAGYIFFLSRHNRKTYAAITLPRSVFIDAGIAIIAFDLDGTVIAYNPAAERMLGYSAVQIIGTASFHLFHSTHEITDRLQSIREHLHVSGNDFDVLIAATHSAQHQYKEWSFIRSDGIRIPVGLSVTSLSDDHGVTIGYIETVFDLSMWKEADSKLIAEWRRNKTALEIAGLGVWELDIVNDHMEYSDNLGPIYGLAYGSFFEDYDDYIDHIHVDDRKLIDEMETRLLKHGATEGMKYRVLYPDGGIHIVSIREYVYRNKAGQPMRIIGLASRMS